jgi:hypothetical protein
MRVTQLPFKALKGLSFSVAELVLIGSWSEANGFRMVVRLDHGSDAEDYEEVLALHLAGSPALPLDHVAWCGDGFHPAPDWAALTIRLRGRSLWGLGCEATGSPDGHQTGTLASLGDAPKTQLQQWKLAARAHPLTGVKSMSNDIITVRLPQNHAAFLQANLALLANTTRQAMTRPGLAADRRTALGSRATLLETIEDAVRGALVELPQSTRKSARGVEVVTKRAA